MAHGFGVSPLLALLAATLLIAVPVLAFENSEVQAWASAVQNKPKSGVTTESTASAKSVRTIVVDQSGRGNYKNVQSAINSVPNGNKQRVVIVIGPGVYRF